MASRARGDDRPFFLGFVAVLLLGAGYALGINVAFIPLIFVIWFAARQSGRMNLWIAILCVCYLVGGLVHGAAPLTLPIPESVGLTTSTGLWGYLLPIMPWGALALAAFWFRPTQTPESGSWWTDAAIAILLSIVLAPILGKATEFPIAAISPVVALLGADMIWEDFRNHGTPGKRQSILVPGWFAIIGLILLPISSALDLKDSPSVSTWYALMAVLLGLTMAWTLRRKLARWTFGVLFISGLLYGRMANQSSPIFEQPGTPRPESVPPILLLIMLGGGAVVWLILIRLFKDAGSRKRVEHYLYGGEGFRKFADRSQVSPSPISARLNGDYSFVIFGDVTGAESPLATRRSGFLAFRALVKRLNEDPPAFAISLGDMASHASPAAYQRIRRLLKQIPVPLAVTPGNHDLFRQNEYDAATFHRIFGADNSAFRIGPVKFVILNNAWGAVQEEQFAWLDRTLSAESAPFTLLFCHKPPFDLRPDGSYAMEDRGHAARLHEMMKAHRVTAVFSGHIHSLLSEARDGVTYVISGGGGSKLTSPRDQHHYLSVKVSKSELVVRAFPLTNKKDRAETPLLELRFASRS